MITPGFSAGDEDWCIPVLQDIARELGQRHEVRVFATCYPHRCDRYEVKGVKVASFGNGRKGRAAWCLRQYRTLRALLASNDKRPFDVVHGYWADGGGVVAAEFKRRRKKPTVVTVMAGELTYEPNARHGNSMRPISGRLALYGAHQASTLVALSEYHQQAIASQNDGLATQVHRFGTDVDRFSPVGPGQILKGEIPVLAVASLNPVKGHEWLIKAFVTAHRALPGMHLHIVGSGRLDETLHSLIAASGASEFVTLHGHVEHHDLPSYYRAARFCVLSSWFESHAMVIVEAAACSRVTIGSRVGSMPVFCDEQYLCQPGDEAALAGAMVELANDSALAEQLAKKSKEIVMEHFAVQHTVSKLEKLYVTMVR